MTPTRRHVLTGTTAAAGLLAAGAAVNGSAEVGAAAQGPARPRGSPFGPLRAAPGDLVALPAGFRYAVVSQTGKTDLQDGSGRTIGKTPANPHGTGCVSTRTGLRLIRNHELRGGATWPVPQVAGTVYDPGIVGGGCTIVETTRQGARVSEWVGLSGTVRNCAGGLTPWGSWLSCEEDETRAGTNGATKDHGYVFEVFPHGPDRQSPRPIAAWGRGVFEAAAIEPSLRRAYLTEDTSDGLFYRWAAPDGVRLKPYLADGLRAGDGRLEAMALLGPDGGVLPHYACLTCAQLNRPFPTRWLPVGDRQAASTPMRYQFDRNAVTRHTKIEGCCSDRYGLYVVMSYAHATHRLPAGAVANDGMVFYYRYADQTMTLKAYYPHNPAPHDTSPGWEARLGWGLDTHFDGPDNVQVTPYGTLIMSEDGGGASHLLAWSEGMGTRPSRAT